MALTTSFFSIWSRPQSTMMLPLAMIALLFLLGTLTTFLSFASLSHTLDKFMVNVKVEGEENFRIKADLLPTPVMLSRISDGLIVYANSSAGKAFGLPATELMGHHITDFYYDPTEQTKVMEAFQCDGQVFNYQIQMQEKDNTPKWFMLFLQPLLFHHDQVIFNVFYDITAQKRAEQEQLRFTEAVQINEKKYRTLFDVANDAIFMIEGDKIIECNPSTLKLFNCTIEQLLGKSPAILSPAIQPDGQTSEDKAIEKISTAFGGTSQVFEWLHTRCDGTLFDAEVSLNSIELNEKHYVQAIVRDITERKRTEDEKIRLVQKLRKSEQLFQVIAETTPVPVIINRPSDDVIVYANEQATVMFGVLTTAELVGRPTKELYLTPEGWQEIANLLIQHGFIYDYETQIKGSDETAIWVSLFSQPTTFNDEPVMVNTIYNITERKRAEEERNRFIKELQESEERFRVIAETTPIPIVITRPKTGAIVYANQQASKVFGAPVAELVNHHITDFYYQAADRIKLLEVFKQSGYVHNYEILLKKIDNTLVWATLFIQPMLLKEEKVFLSAVYDITERKQAEEERQRYVNELRELNVMLTELNAAYERFVPYEFLQLLDKENVIDVKLGDQVEREMTVLFADIRGFTSLSEKMTPQDNFKFLNSYLGQMTPIISEHQGFIDKYIGDAIMALFSNSADDAVHCAVAMLKQLAAYNQIRHTDGLPTLAIGIGINTGPLMLGTVGDENRMEGTVISDTVNLASRVESLTKVYGSSLLITEQTYQQLIEPSHYKIRIIDRVIVKGKTQPATIYEVFDAEPPELVELKLKTLPDFKQGVESFHQHQFVQAQTFFENVLQVHEHDKVAQTYSKQSHEKLSMIMPETSKILIVDDMPVNLSILSTFLTHYHFEVLAAQTGEIALKLAETKYPDLILLDVMMPNMDGFETCQQLKANANTQDIPVIFMTVLSDTINKVKGFELGAVDYIIKPFEPAEVLARIKVHLNLRHLQQQMKRKMCDM
jgi:PAS domain S-box-containing protein